MRLGVLDIGSNTGHLLVVDAHGGAAPLPAYSFKQPLRLAEHLDEAGCRRPGSTR
jgi:exopolyphosphatase / guanosine-5'-triphosphate,3'-diphosphate pyrophosphatase